MLNTGKEADTGLETRIGALRQALIAKRDSLRQMLNLQQWCAVDGTVQPDQVPGLQDRWETITVPYDWLAKDTSKTLYHKLRLSAQFAGVSLLGEQVDLLFCALIGSTLFVNGKSVYSADYWADTQVIPVQLVDHLEGCTNVDLVLHLRQGNGFGLFMASYLSIAAVDDWIFTLDTFAEELGFALFLARANAGEAWMLDALREAVALLDPAVLEEDRWDLVQTAIDEVHRRLGRFEEHAKQYKVSLIGHSHIDMNWLWPSIETIDLVRRDFESVDSIMAEFPEVHFSHSQAATYKMIQDNYPELWQRVKQRIAEGRWEVTAATWVEGDLNMAGHETLARQFLLGKSYSRDELGYDPEVCWEPDTFGHSAALPQLLRQSGIRYYYHSRGGRGEPIFWWEGLDGSRVLVFNDPRSYLGEIYASDIMPGTRQMAERYGVKRNMYVYGFGDHGGGVTRRDVQRGLRLNESRLLPRFEFGKAADFYRDLEASGRSFPVIRGELNTVFEGCYTSHGDIKLTNRATEHALVQAEILSSIAAIAAGRASGMPTELLQAWRTQCFNQFHDILCGCAIHSTYPEAVDAAAQAKDTADNLAHTAMRSAIGSQPDSAGATLTVFNTLAWPRSDVVALSTDDHPQISSWQSGDQLVDGSGQPALLQQCAEGILFIAAGVPALGYKTYSYVKSDAAPDVHRPITTSLVGNPVLDNGRFRVEVDRESGTIVSLIDGALDRELSYGPQSLWVEANRNKGLLNLLEVQYEAPHTMSAWKIGTITRVKRLVEGAAVTIAAEGPVMQALLVEHHADNSTIRQEIRLYQELDRIDFITSVDWREEGSVKSDGPMLRALFTPRLRGARARFDIPFGSIERERDGQEVPAIHWVDLSEDGEEYGLAILNNSKYGYSVQGNTIALSLLRSSYEPDTRPDVGEHHFTYSILPHRGDWRTGRTVQHGWELNQPLLAVGGGEDGGHFSAVTVEEQIYGVWREAPGVLVTAVKPDGDYGAARDLILRLVESSGEKARIRLNVAAPLLAAEEVNLLEEYLRPLAMDADNRIEVGEMQPSEIKTLRIRLKR